MSHQRTDASVIADHALRQRVHSELKRYVGRLSLKRKRELIAIASSPHKGERRRMGGTA